jgi:hypothetical protein
MYFNKFFQSPTWIFTTAYNTQKLFVRVCDGFKICWSSRFFETECKKEMSLLRFLLEKFTEGTTCQK